jgi:hypothetical protein
MQNTNSGPMDHKAKSSEANQGPDRSPLKGKNANLQIHLRHLENPL